MIKQIMSINDIHVDEKQFCMLLKQILSLIHEYAKGIAFIILLILWVNDNYS